MWQNTTTKDPSEKREQEMALYMKKLLRAIAATAVAVASTLVVPVAAQAQEPCPAVAVVAARGSGENGGGAWAPQNYGGPFWSNGREGPTLAAMFHYFESRYNWDTGGSVMNSVKVLGLDEFKYPAAAPERNITPPTDFDSAVNLFREMLLPQAALFRDSFINGTHGVLSTINDYEASSGCHPQYVLAGYSQGSVVMGGVERTLDRQGKLAGVINLGSPYNTQGTPGRIGTGLSGIGVLGWTPMRAGALSGAPRIEYCVADDPFCDLNVRKYLNGQWVDNSAHGSYFRWNSSRAADRDAAARIFASWVDARR